MNKGRTSIISFLAIVLIASTTVTVAVAPAADARRRCFHSTKAAKMFTARMNRIRARHGAGRLELDPQLSHVSHHHDRAMVRSRRLFHTSFGQFDRWVTGWNYIGENVGVGPGVKSLYRAFLHSPEHRANILGSRYNHVGVGTIRRHGRMWVTIQFEAQHNPGTHLHMRRVC
jgi:uncharacterized protein YkwD